MNRPRPPIELIIAVAEKLGDLRDRVTFLGAASVTLLVTDRAARPPRATTDVDVVIDLASLQEFYELEESLRERGFENAVEGPVCRFRHGFTVLDVMPTDPEIIGFSNRWYPAAVKSSRLHTLDNKTEIHLIAPACFLATKFEAFGSPDREGHGDLLASRDFEDIVTVIDGRPSLADDCKEAEEDVRAYLHDRLSALLRERYFLEGIEAHVESGRAGIVAERIGAIVGSLRS